MHIRASDNRVDSPPKAAGNAESVGKSLQPLTKIMTATKLPPETKWPPFCRHLQNLLLWKNDCTLIQIRLQFVPKYPINTTPSMIYLTVWHCLVPSHYPSQSWLSVCATRSRCVDKPLLTEHLISSSQYICCLIVDLYSLAHNPPVTYMSEQPGNR